MKYALNEISMARAMGSTGSRTVVESTLSGGSIELKAEVQHLDDPQPAEAPAGVRPSVEAMKAAVELEIYSALGRVHTVVIGQMIQKWIDAAPPARQTGREEIADTKATQKIINVFVADREDGGVRVWSDDLPGLILSGKNRSKVIADIGRAVRTILQHNGEDASNLRIDATFIIPATTSKEPDDGEGISGGPSLAQQAENGSEAIDPELQFEESFSRTVGNEE